MLQKQNYLLYLHSGKLLLLFNQTVAHDTYQCMET